ncbi:MAG: GNAT family N-acetyltransferase [Saprospiraceae bacterium]
MNSRLMSPTNHPSIFYRIATNTDASDIRKIIFDTLGAYGLNLDAAVTDSDLYDIEHYYPDGTFWVLVDEHDTIKGSFALYRENDKTVEIRKMYFDPSIRGLGLGIWAIHWLLQKAVSLGYHRAQLETASVLKEAIQLYKKMGFVEITGTCHSHRCDVLMEKML